MNDFIACGAIELRHREIGRGIAQNLVGLAKLAVVQLKSLHPLGYIARQACSLAAIDFGLLDPSMQVGWRAADLARD